MTAAMWPAWGRPAPQRSTGGMRYALPVCAAISVAAHVMVLTLRVPPEPPRASTAAASGSPRVMQARLRPQASPAQAPMPAPAVPLDAAPAPDASAARAAPAPVATPTPPSTPGASQSAASGSKASTRPGRDDYIARPFLSVGPAARTPVVLVAPPGTNGTARHVGVLSLFIDEQGVVKRIVADQPSLPPAYEEAAREAFMAARFSPGEVDGVQVNPIEWWDEHWIKDRILSKLSNPVPQTAAHGQ